jgi:sigma-B regulation protein RsbU (phosphoserine phosphatase)
MKILIADDDNLTRIALRKLLDKWGYEVVQAQDGREAWESLCEKDPPRIAILDWMMPGLEGVKICQQLKQEKDFPFIYTMLLSVRREKEDIVNALDSGAHDFLSKPVHAGELRSRIAVGVRLVEAEDDIRMKNKELAGINDQLNQTNTELQRALKEIKTLQGIFPICMHCKKFKLENRDATDPNSWVTMEEYIGNRTEAEFSHGICPICAEELYPGYFKA